MNAYRLRWYSNSDEARQFSKSMESVEMLAYSAADAVTQWEVAMRRRTGSSTLPTLYRIAPSSVDSRQYDDDNTLYLVGLL